MPEQTPTAALAAAIRGLLAEGAEVRLKGIGTLNRVHQPARVEVKADGTRVLHPPHHNVRFDAEDGTSP
jgi:hypothetical protein